MLAFLLPLLKTFWKPLAGLVAIAVVALAFWSLKHSYDEGKRGEGRAEVRTKELKPLQDQVKAAQERASALALEWNSKRMQADQLAAERDHEIAERLAAAKRAAATLPPAVAGVIFPRAAVELLQPAGSSRSAAPAGSASAPGRPAAGIPGPANPARR